VPIRPPATMLTTLEAVFGQFYIAVVVAQLPVFSAMKEDSHCG
jgi:hypothetical protein